MIEIDKCYTTGFLFFGEPVYQHLTAFNPQYYPALSGTYLDCCEDPLVLSGVWVGEGLQNIRTQNSLTRNHHGNTGLGGGFCCYY